MAEPLNPRLYWNQMGSAACRGGLTRDMYAESHGAPDGNPVVFLHGSMVAGWMWMEQVESLSEFNSLLPDLPGFGRSGGEQWVSLADTADRVVELIRERCHDGAAHVVGLSLGGLVALHLASRHPNSVRSMLVSGVPYGALPAPLRALNSALSSLYRRPWGARFVARALGIPPDESMEMFLDTARRSDPSAVRAVLAEVNLGALPDGLETVAVPTLAVAGERDTALAKRAVPHLQSTMPNALGRIVPEVGHQWNAEKPQLFSEMTRAWVTTQTALESLRAV